MVKYDGIKYEVESLLRGWYNDDVSKEYIIDLLKRIISTTCLYSYLPDRYTLYELVEYREKKLNHKSVESLSKSDLVHYIDYIERFNSWGWIVEIINPEPSEHEPEAFFS